MHICTLGRFHTKTCNLTFGVIVPRSATSGSTHIYKFLKDMQLQASRVILPTYGRAPANKQPRYKPYQDLRSSSTIQS